MNARNRTITPPKSVPDTESNTLSPSLERLKKDIKSRIGDNVMVSGADLLSFSYIQSGIFSLDVASGGGFPEGHLSLVYGWEGSFKTAMCIKTIVEAQRKYPHKTVIFVDAETHYDSLWFERLGVNLNKLVIIQNAGIGEDYADILDELFSMPDVSLIILDSVAALVPKSAASKSADDNPKVAEKASLVGKICSSFLVRRQELMRAKLIPPTFIMVNQLRNDIGKFQSFGVPTRLPGGNNQRYLSFLSIELGKGKNSKETKKQGALVVTEEGFEVFENDEGETGFTNPVSTTYSFKLSKPKAGYVNLSGTFDFARQTVGAVKQYSIDDIKTVMAYAADLGMVYGGGAKQKFIMFSDQTFAPENGNRAIDIMGETLLRDPEKYFITKALIIVLNRGRSGMKMFPYDGSVYGVQKETMLPYLELLSELKKKK